jgi:hypothetical protein
MTDVELRLNDRTVSEYTIASAAPKKHTTSRKPISIQKPREALIRETLFGFPVMQLSPPKVKAELLKFCKKNSRPVTLYPLLRNFSSYHDSNSRPAGVNQRQVNY